MDMKIAKKSLPGFASIQAGLARQDFDLWSGPARWGPFGMFWFKVPEIASGEEGQKESASESHDRSFRIRRNLGATSAI